MTTPNAETPAGRKVSAEEMAAVLSKLLKYFVFGGEISLSENDSLAIASIRSLILRQPLVEKLVEAGDELIEDLDDDLLDGGEGNYDIANLGKLRSALAAYQAKAGGKT